MFVSYLHIFIFFIIALIFALGMFFLSTLLSKFFLRNNKEYKLKNKAKYLPYECGNEPFNNTRIRFNTRYYVIAVLFIIFDVEMVFLFPWTVIMKNLAWPAFIAMGIFLFLLILGLVYEWKKGALEWD